MVSNDLILTALETGTDGGVPSPPKESQLTPRRKKEKVVRMTSDQSVDMYFAIKEIASDHFYDTFLFDKPNFCSSDVLTFVNNANVTFRPNRSYYHHWLPEYSYFLDYFSECFNKYLWDLGYRQSIKKQDIYKWVRKCSRGHVPQS